ncbi:MAG: hypothetical protein UX08_C0007G0027 [Candidatus Collierbacteria bacterium GW2011_GWB1_45_35]|uniref:Uncharacterized protein n=1 Tax=Candidatus Collierbacteria bacterium GW2011_GWB2_45_17 TaxID=1618388 RepID=A0A837IIQ1_9BACT|nr:MAG: hypothetical protein UW48_C0001G0083 [Microgenomates group bacterium GW2011_GWC1_44_23]KKT96203.1 MAG: hypothetical protein UW96_C0001G0081 [Candidatus Collierbacteria bacterium GW2011_GWA1_45_15]KKU01243.1 MAG: hypothetical protein UX01_C0001G0087 [Candidatus Collierbacteria bacterium GW2011_GWB2_45_17]KKU05330.1 MAG: hypothetical protein UX08_C0007G0027 [Candidatus Collierbacteria bacterium GW2011_GWB1_45_35]KKU08477.1 MAG: hypothetical protein UX11_C0003G0019 [Candidatus Collierbacte
MKITDHWWLGTTLDVFIFDNDLNPFGGNHCSGFWIELKFLGGNKDCAYLTVKFYRIDCLLKELENVSQQILKRNLFWFKILADIFYFNYDVQGAPPKWVMGYCNRGWIPDQVRDDSGVRLPQLEYEIRNDTRTGRVNPAPTG